jgi:uncharacterized protein
MPILSPPSSAGAGNDQLRATRVFLRPIADPFALGFSGLAGATVTLAGSELGWISHADTVHAALIVLIFAPLLQAIACVFGFLSRDAVAATGMGVLAGTWANIGVVTLTSRPGATSHALGTFLFLAGAVVLVSANVAAMSKLVPAIVLALTAIRFIVTGVHEFVPGTGWKTASGIIGLVLGFAAVYGAASLEIESMRRSPLLPVGRHGSGRQALTADLSVQVNGVAAEAGVRKQL